MGVSHEGEGAMVPSRIHKTESYLGIRSFGFVLPCRFFGRSFCFCFPSGL